MANLQTIIEILKLLSQNFTNNFLRWEDCDGGNDLDTLLYRGGIAVICKMYGCSKRVAKQD